MLSGRRKVIFIIPVLTVIWFLGCTDTISTPIDPEDDLTSIPYQPVPYNPNIPEGFPAWSNRPTIE